MSADIRGLTVQDGFTDTSIIHRDCYLCLSDRELSPANAGPISQRLRGPISTTLYTHPNFLLGCLFRVLVRVLLRFWITRLGASQWDVFTSIFLLTW